MQQQLVERSEKMWEKKLCRQDGQWRKRGWKCLRYQKHSPASCGADQRNSLSAGSAYITPEHVFICLHLGLIDEDLSLSHYQIGVSYDFRTRTRTSWFWHQKLPPMWPDVSAMLKPITCTHNHKKLKLICICAHCQYFRIICLAFLHL